MASTSTTKEVKKALKLSEVLSQPQEFVTLIVGSSKKKFVIHKSVICYHSPFFAKAFNSQFKEGLTQEMELPDDEEEIVGLLASWAYSQSFEVAEQDASQSAITKGEEVIRAGKLWVLARRFLMPNLQNMALDVVHAKLRQSLMIRCQPFFEMICQEEAEPLMRLAIEVLFLNLSREQFIQYVHILPAKMILDLAKEGRIRYSGREAVAQATTFYVNMDN